MTTRITTSLIPRLHEMPTLAELPVTGAVSAKQVNAAIALTSARHKVYRFIEAAHLAQAVQCEIARIENMAMPVLTPAELLKSALRRLFMATTGYYHEHLDATMPVQVRGALARVYQASQGGLVQGHVIFVDLRTLGTCEASQCDSEVAKLVGMAEQALCAMKLG